MVDELFIGDSLYRILLKASLKHVDELGTYIGKLVKSYWLIQDHLD